MRNYVKENRSTILPLGLASAAMSLIMAVAIIFSEISPAAII